MDDVKGLVYSLEERPLAISRTRTRVLGLDLKVCIDCHCGFQCNTRFYWLVKRCKECKRNYRLNYLKSKYRRTHPKKTYKEERILNALYSGKKTMEELAGIAKSNPNGVRWIITNLRKKGHKIVKKGSYYKRIV